MKKVVYLGLGSNLKDRKAQIDSAITRLGELGKILAVSSYYETEPMDVARQPWFLNCAVALETELMPKQLLAAVLDIEQSMGRRRTQPKGPRIIDIDILLFGNSVLNAPGLGIPHPRMQERRFVLEPLAEIAPQARHPVLKKTIAELRDALGTAGGQVRRINASAVAGARASSKKQP